MTSTAAVAAATELFLSRDRRVMESIMLIVLRDAIFVVLK